MSENGDRRNYLKYAVSAVVAAGVVGALVYSSRGTPEVVQQTIEKTVVKTETVAPKTVVETQTVEGETIVQTVTKDAQTITKTNVETIVAQEEKGEVTQPDRVNISFRFPPASADPQTSTNVADIELMGNVYDTMLGYIGDSMDRGGNIAESWDSSSDMKTWTFKLRKGLTFHDGSALTAADVAYSFSRLARMKQRALGLTLGLIEADTAVAVDDHTVRFDLPDGKFYPFLPLLLTSTMGGGIVNSKLLEANGGIVDGEANSYLVDNAAGSGPYSISNWEKGIHATLARFDDFYKGPAATKELKFHELTESATKIAMLKKGDLDIYVEFPPSRVADVLGAKGIVTNNEGPANGALYVTAMNNSTTWAEKKADDLGLPSGTFKDNKDMRLALAWAVDYDKVIDIVFGGFATQASGHTPYGIEGIPGQPETDPRNVPPPFLFKKDLDKAKEYFKKSGIPEGTPWEIMTFPTDASKKLIVVLKESFDALGLDVTTAVMDIPAYVGKLFSAGGTGKTSEGKDGGHFDMSLGAHGFGIPSSITMMPIYQTDSPRGYYKFSDARLDAIFAEIDTLTKADDAARTMEPIQRHYIHRSI